MKQFLKYTLPLLLGTQLMLSCSKDELQVPSQPDFIIVGLDDPHKIQMGELFDISVPEEPGATEYAWTLPEMLNVIEGENSSRLRVVGLAAGTITKGVISVTAINAAGSSTARTLWKDIIITSLPARPAYVQSSIKGSLTVDKDEEFTVYVPDDDNIVSYEWSVPENMEIVSGGKTTTIVVKATRSSVYIDANTITVTTVSKTGVTEVFHFEKMLCVLPTDGYPAKRYGLKTWMITNLNSAGEDGTVGLTAPTDVDGTLYGRYYTWQEAMTGFSAGENPYVFNSKGTDDMGNEYTLDHGPNSYNIQIQGICPKGWHIPNGYDFYDLAVGVADDYGLRKNSIEDVVAAKAGIYLPNNRETDPTASMIMISYGFIGSYLRGSRPATEGGMWAAHAAAVDGGTMFNLQAASGKFPAGKYPMYFPDKVDQIGFNILPCGKFTVGATNTLGNFGTYSFHWTATILSDGTNRRFTIGNNSVNFSTSPEKSTAACNLRCVANY